MLKVMSVKKFDRKAEFYLLEHDSSSKENQFKACWKNFNFKVFGTHLYILSKFPSCLVLV